ncbi:MAG: winged helix-turn-helix transcriptional regulator [Thaumarchaeota archaeon]|nr:winged helix-turn-helix transcriptional regulator [Nitrososphaerota archaeon]
MSDAFMMSVDAIDRRILEILMDNARMPSRQIAKRLREEGHDIQDRAVSYRIERLEKRRIIQGYETVLRRLLVEDFEALYLRFRTVKSSEFISAQICSFIADLPNCLMTVTVSGKWNLLVLTAKDELGKKSGKQIIERFHEYIEDYRTANLKFESINALNMQSVMI